MTSEHEIRPTGKAGTRATRSFISFCATRSQTERLERLVERQEFSRSFLIRQAIDRMLDEAGV